MIFAVDPGKHHIAISIIGPLGHILWAGAVRSTNQHAYENAATIAMGITDLVENQFESHTFSIVCIERMLSYPKSKVNPNDLMDLSFVGGAVMGALITNYMLEHPPIVLCPYAKDWKGTLTKAEHHEQMFKKLGEAETARIRRYAIHYGADCRNDIYDAIGIGLWAYDYVKKNKMITPVESKPYTIKKRVKEKKETRKKSTDSIKMDFSHD